MSRAGILVKSGVCSIHRNSAGHPQRLIRTQITASRSCKNTGSFNCRVTQRAALCMAASKSEKDNVVLLEEPSDSYRENVGIMLLNDDDMVFSAVRLNDEKGYWQMPQGGIDAGEDPWSAAQRELYEETGVKDIEFIAKGDTWYAYDFPPEMRAKLYGGWEKYKGQAQMWFMVRLTGPESQVDISGLGEKPEFSKWKWMKMEELADNAIPFKQAVYKEVVRDLGRKLHG